jgi:oligoendopeptidase F
MILNLLVANPEAEVNSAKQEELINQAREELSQAYNIFSNVSDPELVNSGSKH